MQKFRALLTTLACAAALAAMLPAQAQTLGGTYYNPDSSSGDGRIGCGASTYAEPWDNINQWWYWNVPYLEDGESIMLANDVSGPYGYIPASNNSNPTWLMFTCSGGYISGGASFGYWW